MTQFQKWRVRKRPNYAPRVSADAASDNQIMPESKSKPRNFHKTRIVKGSILDMPRSQDAVVGGLDTCRHLFPCPKSQRQGGSTKGDSGHEESSGAYEVDKEAAADNLDVAPVAYLDARIRNHEPKNTIQALISPPDSLDPQYSASMAAMNGKVQSSHSQLILTSTT